MPVLFLAATMLRLAVPPFGVDNAPARYADDVPAQFMAAVAKAGCAEAIGGDTIPAATSTAIRTCANDSGCVAQAASALTVDFVVVGDIRHKGSRYQIGLDIIEGARKHRTQHLDQDFESLLSGLPSAVKDLTAGLCKAVQSQRPSQTAMEVAEIKARQNNPTAAVLVPLPATPEPKRAPEVTHGDDLSLDLPLTPTPPAPAPATPHAASPPAGHYTLQDLPPIEGPETAFDQPGRPLTTPPPPVPPPAPPPPPVVQSSPSTSPPPQQPTALNTTPTPLPAPPPAAKPLPPEAMNGPPPAPGPTARDVLRKVPWGWVVLGAAVASAGVGVAYGIQSRQLWANDHTTVVGGVTQHSITYVSAAQANSEALDADISYGVAGGLAVIGGSLFAVKF